MTAFSANPAQRYTTLDIARGIALLGIFTINLPDMAYPEDLAMNRDPTGMGGTVDHWILLILEILFYGKMRGLFAVIFGISAGLMISRLASTHSRRFAAAIFYRRLFWLAVFGLVDAYILLWWGDILFKYAVVGCLLYPLFFVRWRILVALTVACAGFLILQTALDHRAVQLLETAYDDVRTAQSAGQPATADDLDILTSWEDVLDDHLPDPEFIEDDIAARSGGYLTAFEDNAAKAFEDQTVIFLEEDAIDILPYMILGLVLFRMGLLRRTLSGPKPLILSAAGIAVGLALQIWAVPAYIEHYTDPTLSSFYLIFIELGRLPLVLGYLIVILAVFNRVGPGLLASALAATGRMSLTNYVAQSVVAMLLFYGFGLSWFNALTRLDLVAVMAAVWLFHLGFSMLWLKHFRLGPLEWAWRSLTYWDLQPLVIPQKARP